MSTMLNALKNLSTRPPEFPAADESPAPEKGAKSPAAEAAPAATPLDHNRRMKELLVKHLSAPTPSEMLDRLRGEILHPHLGSGGGNMTVPIPNAFPTTPGAELPPVAQDDGKREPSVRESISVTFPMSAVGGTASPSISVGASLDRMSDLLATITEEDESPAEEVSVSFVFGEGGGREQGSEVKGQEAEGQVSGSEIQAPDAHPVAPEPISEAATPPPTHPDAHTPSPLKAELETPNVHLETPVAASPLDHLADARPLVTYQPEEEEPPPAPAPLKLPPRTISRSKTRLEQRVVDSLADPSRSAPYRDLADRIAQDLRLLSGRCLLFAGIGSASHVDDLLAHLAALMAEDNEEILLVDADFARAGLSVGLGALKETGLGELLEHAGRSEELVLPTLLPNVSLLPAGRKALGDSLGVVDHLAQLLAKVEDRYALILVDGGAHTQPLSPSLSRLCDATYFVVRLGATDARTATTALKTFRGCGARVMGCVATKAG